MPLKNVFGHHDESHEDDESEQCAVDRQLARENARSQKIVEVLEEKAVGEDARIFDYDGIYDEMKSAEARHRLQLHGIQHQKEVAVIRYLLY